MSVRDPLPAKDMYFVICRTDWDEVADKPGKYGLARRSRPSFPTLEAAGKYAQGISLAREPIILRRVGEPGCPACDGNGPDARLMAAAPSLLAALERLVEAVDPGSYALTSGAVECARAAIAKATAEEVKP